MQFDVQNRTGSGRSRPGARSRWEALVDAYFPDWKAMSQNRISWRNLLTDFTLVVLHSCGCKNDYLLRPGFQTASVASEAGLELTCLCSKFADVPFVGQATQRTNRPCPILSLSPC